MKGEPKYRSKSCVRHANVDPIFHSILGNTGSHKKETRHRESEQSVECLNVSQGLEECHPNDPFARWERDRCVETVFTKSRPQKFLSTGPASLANVRDLIRQQFSVLRLYERRERERVTKCCECAKLQNRFSASDFSLSLSLSQDLDRILKEEGLAKLRT